MRIDNIEIRKENFSPTITLHTDNGYIKLKIESNTLAMWISEELKKIVKEETQEANIAIIDSQTRFGVLLNIQ